MLSSLRKVMDHWTHPTRTTMKMKMVSALPRQMQTGRVRVGSMCISTTVAPRSYRTSQTMRNQTWPPIKATVVAAQSIWSRNAKKRTLNWIPPSMIFRQSSQTILMLIISNDKNGIHGGIFSQTSHVNIGNVFSFHFVFILLFTLLYFLFILHLDQFSYQNHYF